MSGTPLLHASEVFNIQNGGFFRKNNSFLIFQEIYQLKRKTFVHKLKER